MKIPIWVRRWNKKIHIYLGLYMLLFLWLFSISGLFINHHNWFERPPQPVQVKWEKPIELPQGADDQAKAEDLRAQLSLSGEILRSRGNRKPPPGHFTFILVGLDKVMSVDADLEKSVASIQYRAQTAPSLIFRRTIENLHVLSGVRGIWQEPLPKTRDWWVVQLWSFSMDAVSVGFMVMVATSIYMWYLRRRTWLVGSIVFAAGLLSCSFFIWGIRWLT